MSAKVAKQPFSRVERAEWDAIALDATGDNSERAWKLTLSCGHVVHRRVAWGGAKDPDEEPAPRRALCELCAGKPAAYRTAESVRLKNYERLSAHYKEKDETHLILDCVAEQRLVTACRDVEEKTLDAEQRATIMDIWRVDCEGCRAEITRILHAATNGGRS